MRILYCSDFLTLNTGYANVSRELVKRLQSDGHDVIFLPIAGFVGGAFSKNVLGVETLPAVMNHKDIYYWYVAKDIDVVIILKDPYPLAGIEQYPMFTIFYAPICEEPVSKKYVEITGTAMKIWLPSRFWIEVASKRIGMDRMEYMPHGVQPEFRPLHDINQDAIRKQLGFENIDVMISIVSVNRHRKLLPNQLEGIKMYIDNNPDLKVGIYLHTSPAPDVPQVHGGWDLLSVLDVLGIRHLVVFPEPYTYRIGISLNEMNILYNVTDCLVNATTEGFGLPIIESQAAGTPVVTVNHGNGPEINFLGLNAKVGAWFYSTLGTRIAVPDPGSIADNIEKGVSCKDKYRDKLAAEAREKFDWDYVYDKYFRRSLERIYSELDAKKIVEVC